MQNFEPNLLYKTDENWIKTVLIDRGMISPKDIHLLQLADTPEQVGEIIEKFYTENHLSPNF